MADLDFLVPSALVDPDIAPDVLRDQVMPTFARIVAHASRSVLFDPPLPASLTTWQAWLFGERAGQPVDAINIAASWGAARGLAADAAHGRYLLEPAHFEVANDHLRLDDPGSLAIDPAEARALAAAAAPILAEAGWLLDPIASATHWFARRNDGSPLAGAAIDLAIGGNVAEWQPRNARSPSDGDAALAWRRCVNEIQMLWFDHPVNAARDTRGRSTINTLWLSGNGGPPLPPPRYASVTSTLPLLAAIPIDRAAVRRLETFDGFVACARREDWGGWREQLAILDARLDGIVREQAAGTTGVATLVLCGRDRARVVTLAPRDLGKRWRGWFGKAPSPAVLLDEGQPA